MCFRLVLPLELGIGCYLGLAARSYVVGVPIWLFGGPRCLGRALGLRLLVVLCGIGSRGCQLPSDAFWVMVAVAELLRSPGPEIQTVKI